MATLNGATMRPKDSVHAGDTVVVNAERDIEISDEPEAIELDILHEDRDVIVINKPPIQLFGLRWRVTILEKHMQIGCELHKLSDWAKYDDARIAAMDGRNSLRFWRAHKDVLLGLARSAGRGAATEPAPAPATAE